jgi:methylmalonyl-CoA mutase cobalamin-binding domain/chain
VTPSGELKALADALADLNTEKVMTLVKKLLDKGEDPLQIVEVARKGMTQVGKRFERMEYFLTELVTSGVIFEEAMKLIEPKLKEGCKLEQLGKVVLGTVKGDIHDIGKNIVGTLLRCSGYEVIDLGIDVFPDAFVKEVQRSKPQILALSALLATSFNSMKEAVDALSKAGLRDKVSVIIGGGPVDAKAVKYVGADGYASDAMGAVRLVESLIQKQKQLSDLRKEAKDLIHKAGSENRSLET